MGACDFNLEMKLQCYKITTKLKLLKCKEATEAAGFISSFCVLTWAAEAQLTWLSVFPQFSAILESVLLMFLLGFCVWPLY